VCGADFVLALDTLSTGFPATLAGFFLRVPVLLRTGGDFLYEQYVERTRQPILLSEFYVKSYSLNVKEKIVFKIIRWTLRNISALIFSTEWQRDIFLKPYALEKQNIFIVQNRFDTKASDEPWVKKNFLFATRNIAYKNIEKFSESFARVQKNNSEISLEIIHTLPHEQLLEKMKTCYAVVMPSLGEISPHVILDALRMNKPFILTQESGYAELLHNVGVLVDPQSVADMQRGIEMLCDSNQYTRIHTQVRAFTHTHTWAQIADEILAIYEKITI
jgi:glycosyltransferase involved in cell wall biosynthesis